MNVQLLKQYLEPKSILDIGASIGALYREFKQVYPDAYYYLIEANPDCEPYLQVLNVDYFIGALSSTEGTALFYKDASSPTSTGNSLYKENSEHFRDDNLLVVECKTYTLDNLFADAQFDLIKLDVQGSELDIMRGGAALVQRAKGVILELSIVEYNINAPLEQEVIEYMNSIGFTEEEEIGSHYNPITYELFQRDVLFINRNL
jgi:FkbM family methyltransferase